VRQPSVLLLDEPFSHLDAHLRRDLRETLQKIREADPVTTIFVTHDQREALALGDRIAVMHEGAVAQLGTSRELMSQPVNRFTARFIGDPPVNLVDGNVREGRFESSGLAFELSPEQMARLPAGPVLLGIRPYAIQPGQPGEGNHVVLVTASPRASLMLGSHWETRLTLEGGDELVAVTPHQLTTSEFHFEKKEALFFARSEDGRNLLAET
jgi:multiple sugar transport system ATP-binding protein